MFVECIYSKYYSYLCNIEKCLILHFLQKHKTIIPFDKNRYYKYYYNNLIKEEIENNNNIYYFLKYVTKPLNKYTYDLDEEDNIHVSEYNHCIDIIYKILNNS